MTDLPTSNSKNQLRTLALIGLLLLVLFAAGFFLLVSSVGVWGRGGEGDARAILRYCIYPYLVVISVYVGYMAARFAAGRGKPAWLWGIVGFILSLLFILGLPGLLSTVFPNPNLTIFAGPAIVTFLAPIFSASLILISMSIRRKAPR